MKRWGDCLTAIPKGDASTNKARRAARAMDSVRIQRIKESGLNLDEETGIA